MEEGKFRNKIYWITFFMNVLVIWVHSENAELFMGKTIQAEELYEIEKIFGVYVGQIAVPAFFMVSGYLFYRNLTPKDIKRKINSRIYSVMFPFIIYNFLYYIGYVIASRIPVFTEVVGKGIIPFHIAGVVDAIINYRYNYVFWYLRQLMVLVFLSPILYKILRSRIRWIFYMILSFVIYKQYTIPYINPDAMLYYSFAGALALHWKKNVETYTNTIRRILGAVFLIVGIMMGLIIRPKEAGVLCDVLYRMSVPSGIWLMLDENKLSEAKEWMKIGFFVYSIHFAVVRILNKTIAFFVAPKENLQNMIVPLAIYIFMPAVVWCIGYFISRIVKKNLPLIWKLLSGGRL